jgi:ferredoxin
MAVRVIIDQQRCFGYGRCVNIAPEVFTLGEDGRAVARDASDIDRDQLEMAAWSCPMQAITVVNEGTLVDDGVEAGVTIEVRAT